MWEWKLSPPLAERQWLILKKCFLLHLILKNCWLKTFLRKLILMMMMIIIIIISLPVFLLELLWKCIIFLQHPCWLRRSKLTLICQMHLVLIVFQWWFWRYVSLNFHTYQRILQNVSVGILFSRLLEVWHLRFLYLKMLGRGLQLKTTTL